MIDPHADPRTEDTLAYDLLRARRDDAEPEVVGRATFSGGRSTVEAPEAVKIAVEELLGRAFVDRIQADERPRGYRRTGRGVVDMLIPGMPEHFIARLRGLWLSYPDGSVVTARAASTGSSVSVAVPDSTDVGSPVTDPRVRRDTLVQAEQTAGVRPLVRGHPPDTGLRPFTETPPSTQPISRTDCGWLV